MTEGQPPRSPAPWTPDQKLRADATDEQIRLRLIEVAGEMESHPASRLYAVFVAREYAEARVAHKYDEMERRFNEHTRRAAASGGEREVDDEDLCERCAKVRYTEEMESGRQLCMRCCLIEMDATIMAQERELNAFGGAAALACERQRIPLDDELSTAYNNGVTDCVRMIEGVAKKAGRAIQELSALSSGERATLTDEQVAIIHAEPRNERERIMQITLKNRDVYGYGCDCHDEIFSDAEIAAADAIFTPSGERAGEVTEFDGASVQFFAPKYGEVKTFADPTVPVGEIHFRSPDGKLLGKIVNIDMTAAISSRQERQK